MRHTFKGNSLNCNKLGYVRLNKCVLFSNKHSGNASIKIARFIKHLLLGIAAVSYVASHTTCSLMLQY
jgi:hypothetical protein